MERKDALKKWFLCNKQLVSLKTDIWVSLTTCNPLYNRYLLILLYILESWSWGSYCSMYTGASYIVIPVHYIDAYWRSKKLVMGFLLFNVYLCELYCHPSALYLCFLAVEEVDHRVQTHHGSQKSDYMNCSIRVFG